MGASFQSTRVLLDYAGHTLDRAEEMLSSSRISTSDLGFAADKVSRAVSEIFYVRKLVRRHSTKQSDGLFLLSIAHERYEQAHALQQVISGKLQEAKERPLISRIIDLLSKEPSGLTTTEITQHLRVENTVLSDALADWAFSLGTRAILFSPDRLDQIEVEACLQEASRAPDALIRAHSRWRIIGARRWLLNAQNDHLADRLDLAA